MPHRQPSQPRSQSRSQPQSRTPSTDDTPTSENLALAVIEANQRWWALQIEALQAALAENTQQSKTMLENASKTADTLGQWPQFYGAKARRYTDLTRTGMEIATQTFAQLNQLMGQLFSASLTGVAGLEAGAGSGGEAEDGEEGFIERRVAARIISFPERRKSSQQRSAATEAAGSDQEHPGRRRKSA